MTQSTQAIRYIIDSLSVGGTEKHLSYVLPELQKKGFKIRIIVLQPRQENDIVVALEKAGILLSFYPRYLQFKWLPPLLVNGVRLWIDFIRDRQTPVHFFLPRAYLLGGIAATLAFLPAPQWMSRRSTHDYQKKYPRLASIERWLHRRMEMILTNSQKALEELHQAEQVPRHKLKLIYNGVPVTVVSRATQKQLRHTLKLNRQQLVITMVANLIPYKGHGDLLKALAIIQPLLPKEWVCLIVGRDEGLLKTLRQKAQALHIEPHIQWLGARHDVPALLSISTVSVLCSYEEGFSNVILESMMQKCALVVTAVGGNTESVINRETGLVVPPKHPQLLGEAILNLSQDAQLRQRLRIRAKKRAQDLFSLEQCVAGYVDFYQGRGA